MNPEGQIPRSRGGISGVLLILLGLWGGVAPFVGPVLPLRLHTGRDPGTTTPVSLGLLDHSRSSGAARWPASGDYA